MKSSAFFQESKSILNDKDKKFLKKSIANIKKSINLYQKEQEKEEESLQQMPYMLGEYGSQIYFQLVYIRSLARLISDQTQQIETLEKIQKSQPITFDQQQFLLKTPYFEDTIVAKYPLVEVKPTEHKKTTCVIL